jgi:hypothetical protein
MGDLEFDFFGEMLKVPWRWVSAPFKNMDELEDYVYPSVDYKNYIDVQARNPEVDDYVVDASNNIYGQVVYTTSATTTGTTFNVGETINTVNTFDDMTGSF